MPLLQSVGVAEPPATQPTPDPPRPPRRVEQPYISWTPNGGPELLLVTGSDVVALAGIMGMGVPAEERHETPLVDGGFILNHRRAKGGEIMLPVKVARGNDETLTTFTAKRRDLYRAFDPQRGAGVLQWALPDGSRRYLRCTYVEGLESPLDGEQGAVLWAHHQIVLRAEDPYWFGDEKALKFSAGQQFQFYAPPGDPNVFYISSSTTTGDAVVSIDGEVEFGPEFRLTGPITTAVLGNRDTGKTMELTPNLTAGQILVVRMADGTKPLERFTRNGTSVWRQVAGDFPVFWKLRPGENRITVSAEGTSPSSLIELRYRPRYLSA